MTVTGILRTLDNLADRHWTLYQKFFYREAWSLKELSIALLIYVIYPMILESGVLDEVTGKPVANMAIDDTTAGRCGKTVNGRAPLALVLLTMTKAWYARCAKRKAKALPTEALAEHYRQITYTQLNSDDS